MRFDKLVCIEEAMAKHMNLTNKLKASRPPPNPALHLISAMRQILRRTLDSPKVRSTPNSPTKTLTKIHGSVLTRFES